MPSIYNVAIIHDKNIYKNINIKVKIKTKRNIISDLSQLNMRNCNLNDQNYTLVKI